MQEEDDVQIGERLDDIELVDDRGARWRLADQAGRPTLLIFHRHLM